MNLDDAREHIQYLLPDATWQQLWEPARLACYGPAWEPAGSWLRIEVFLVTAEDGKEMVTLTYPGGACCSVETMLAVMQVAGEKIGARPCTVCAMRMIGRVLMTMTLPEALEAGVPPADAYDAVAVSGATVDGRMAMAMAPLLDDCTRIGAWQVEHWTMPHVLHEARDTDPLVAFWRSLRNTAEARELVERALEGGEDAPGSRHV